ncbi:hypothetical protein [Ruminococcus sp.]|uniref:hypothetical protein n=1 Tax=Ruminococcus sp. TaxID=41978 RepID=UPI0025F31B62|nr:hypothetical protein [Ruminococcus sp.]MBQ8967014.1 hypothetical protein [Ruminococcus sp.]
MRTYIEYAAAGLGAGLLLMLGDRAVGGQLLFGIESSTAGLCIMAALLTASRKKTPLHTFVCSMALNGTMGLVLTLYAVRPQRVGEWLTFAAILLAGSGLAALCSKCREKYRLWVLCSLAGLAVTAAEGLELMTAYFTINKGLPLAGADLAGGCVCLWVMLGRKKKAGPEEEQQEYPTDEEGNRLPDGDEQWLL